MRRIIHNTTAIAACLSLMAPHLAMAQTAAVEGEAQQQQPEVLPPEAEQQPEGAEDPLADALAQQEEAGAEVGDAAGQAEAEAEAAAEEPQPAAEAAAPVEEPAEEAQPAEETVDEGAMDAQPEPMAEEQDATEQPAAEPADAASEASSAEGAADDMAADDMTAGEVAPEEDAAAETSDAAEPVGDPLAEALEAEQADAPEAASEAQAEAEPAEEMTDETTGSEPAAEEAETDQDPLAEALAAEQEASEAEDSDAQADGAPADMDQPAEDMTDEAADTTDGEAATDQDPLAEALEQEQSGAEGAEQDAEATEESAEAPEADAKETEAAKEAAEASEAPKAAALDDDASSDAEITEEQVTEDNSRSSAEDFATSLSEALGAATGQSEAEARSREDDDDDDNDLTKALLLGAGALAVGAMLNNNRQVSLSTPDRVVVTRPDGSQQVIKDEVALLRQPGSTVATENFDDGSSRTIVTRQDGSKVVTIRDADLRVLRRTLVSADGTTTRLIDDTSAQPVDIASLPAPAATSNGSAGEMNEDQLREALRREANVDRRFSLAQIRDIPQVRALVAPVAISGITFDTGSAAISPDQAKQLSTLGNALRESIAENSGEVFLIEGHTDTVGSDAANLALSDRRAESVALALTEYFDVPPENMVVQGYGEQYLQVRREGDVRQNRRASVRRITDLLQQASAD
ncbi:OmpA family protein [Paracoccus sp. R12_1]|uniref:OmpA family protein n=1 Tax=unclassified Paracoccus (in: a-proteobacteria) TaxID=2688777 RepID=UPI001ADB193D|nr:MULTISPECIES: OmpA family protein [unclassified Paracoccus (in: a-proteobacteria)]MBO9457148.1 OmpA family protein [Paracoccus sp. R12_2]MBO9488423.1 OmpA family protein [Paracoccus sp. R12_1]